MTDKKQPQKKYFDVRVEALVPATITYRVLATDAQDALKQIDKSAPKQFKPNLLLKRAIKASVSEAGSLIIKFTKTFQV